jgi:hypothetical protein
MRNKFLVVLFSLPPGLVSQPDPVIFEAGGLNVASVLLDRLTAIFEAGFEVFGFSS